VAAHHSIDIESAWSDTTRSRLLTPMIARSATWRADLNVDSSAPSCFSKNHLLHPMRPVTLNPIQDAFACSLQRRNVFAQQDQANRQHPNPEQGKDAEQPAGN
jgi:hypothetical protein